MLRIIKSDQTNGIIDSYEFPVDFEDEIKNKKSNTIESVLVHEKKEIDKKEKTNKNNDNGISPVEKDAFQIMSETKKKVDDILKKAKEEAEKIKNDAFEEGKNEGYEKGYKDGYDASIGECQKELEDLKKQVSEDFESLLIEISEEKESIIKQYLIDIRDLAVSIAEKVIRVSLRSSGEIIENMILSATEKLRNKEWVKIYLSKIDTEMLLKTDTDIIKALAHVSDHIRLIPMENETEGTCIIELPDEIIDASANTQLENINEMLKSTGM